MKSEIRDEKIIFRFHLKLLLRKSLVVISIFLLLFFPQS